MDSLDNDVELLYAERPEWADVVPVEQYEGVNPLAPIIYSPEYKDATDYFRGVMKTGEMSQRVLELTEEIIRMNPAHYSAWQYRYKTLIAIQAPLDVELKLMDALAVQFLKTYQVWHHRRLLLTALASPETARTELAFVARALEEDTKNYHTWTYRQWILAHFDDEELLWKGERAWTEKLLDDDVRNNSAWHHRFFVVWLSGVRKGDEDRQEVLKRELAYVKEKIALAPNNPSAWNYLRGILEHTATSFAVVTTFVVPYTVESQSTENAVEGDIVSLDDPLPSAGAQLPCVAALEFMADIYEREGGEAIGKAVQLWKTLADERDIIRKNYWEYRIKEALQDSAQ